MDIFSKNRMIFRILLFLVVVNVATIVTLFVHIRKPATSPASSEASKPGVALRQELNLTDEQSEKIGNINAVYRKKSDPIFQAIQEKKSELLDELSKPESDSLQLSRIADEVGNEQKKLQQANIEQFLALKKVCSPEQTQRLSRIYAGLYGCENRGQGRGNGQGRGMQHRHRWGQRQDTTATSAK